MWESPWEGAVTGSRESATCSLAPVPSPCGAVVAVWGRFSRCDADGAWPKVQCAARCKGWELGAVFVDNIFVMMDWHGCLGVVPLRIAVAIIW